MCEDCGCQIHIDRPVTEANDTIAIQNCRLFSAKGIFCINIMGAPGSGKTTIIEGLANHINPSEIAVIQGDLESDVDKQRLDKIPILTHQINTHSGCHLNASMINSALMDISLKCKKYLIIENVGNLVCPAGVNLGQHMNIVVSSTTEGSDKPKKYPIIFRDADVIVISKNDLPVEFDEKQYMKDILAINRKAKILKTSKDKSSCRELAHIIEHERKHYIGKDHYA